jgi:hypothetical protein
MCAHARIATAQPTDQCRIPQRHPWPSQVCRSWTRAYGCTPPPAVTVWPQPRQMSVGSQSGHSSSVVCALQGLMSIIHWALAASHAHAAASTVGRVRDAQVDKKRAARCAWRSQHHGMSPTRATCIILFVVCVSSDCDSHTAQHNTGPCTLETLSLIHSFDPAFT